MYKREAKSNRILQQWLQVMPKGWGTFGDEGMHKGERSMLYEILDDDEDVLALVGATFRADTNRLHKHKGVSVATSKRVIFLDKSILGSTEVMEIGYRSIEAITYSSGMMMGGVQITGLGAASFRIEDIRPKDSTKPFSECVRNLIEATRQQDAVPQLAGSTSAVEELEKLAALLVDGHITAEEFATMKGKILSR